MDLAPGAVVERYTVEQRLGSGGMAVVWLVRHNQLGTLHAMKVLSVPTASVRKRLRDEGRLQGALRHPNVVAVTDLVDVGGCPALVMEYVAGPSLADLLADQRLTVAQADDLGRGLLLGLEAAHRRGLVHRDVKPGNVLLSVESGSPVPKIADFGLAKVLGGDPSGDPGLTRTGSTLGTPAYMAPEQVRDARSVDARADLFSVGAVLYELLTGARAFRGEDTLELLQNVAAARFVPVRELAPKAPERMAAAIEAALVADPERRVQDCSALLALWTGKERRTWSGEAWDQVSMFRLETLGASANKPRSEASLGDPTFALPSATATLTAQDSEHTVSVEGVPLPLVTTRPAVFEMAPGRTVELTRGLVAAVAPLSRALAAALGVGEAAPGPAGGIGWEQAAELCNALSERTGLPPAYTFGAWSPRRTWSIDDAGRALYDLELLPFDRIGPILKAFGAETLAVLQHEPLRLAEVDGIGPKTARRVAAAWDRWRFFGRAVALAPDAPGWRLPTEAELLHLQALGGADRWEWTSDADPGPVFADRPTPLPPGRFVDPAPDQGPLRVVLRAGRRGVRPPETRAEDLGFRPVRTTT